MAEKHKLQIHCTNVFHPKPLGISHISTDGDGQFVAIVRKLHFKNDQEKLKLRHIEIHRALPKLVLAHSFVEYEQITGLGWLSKDLLLTVSLEQTINIYSIKTGQKIFSVITDYGPITSLKLSLEQDLLVTGTEYGYVAAYQIGHKCRTVEPINKMVKINGSVDFLDLNITTRANRPQAAKPKVIPNGPTKRKRTKTSDGESESEDEDDVSPKEFLDEYEISIFGASGGDVVVWDYHKRTIIDTIHISGDAKVNVLLALSSGEVVVGDSTGTVSVLDTNTFTCRYSASVLDSQVLSLAKNFNESSLIVSGQDSAVIIMNRDKSNRDEYRLKEKIEAHTSDITSLGYLGKNQILSGSLEGVITRFKRVRENFLERDIIRPDYSNNVTYFDGEMMTQNHKNLTIWGLMKTDRNTSNPDELTNLEPTKVLVMKARNHIQSCFFNNKYIAYSGPHRLNVFRRDAPGKTTLLHADKSLGGCSCLKIYGNYLVACSNNDITVIELDENQEDLSECKIAAKHSLKSIVQQLVFMEDARQLIVSCGPIKNLIYRLDFNPDSAEPFGILDKIKLKGDWVSRMVSSPFGKYVYLYTGSDKILRVNATSMLNESKIQKRLDGKASIQGLPRDVHILGIIILTKDHCILYDSNCMYKVDMNANEIVNRSSNYNHIVAIDNRAFGDPQDLALAELSLDDYRNELPSIVRPRKKPFGLA